MIETFSDIRYLERHEIDIAKWDHAIASSANGLIYARSFYLDCMAENWSALIAGDYEFLMPLTWNKKFGLSYLYQPYFTKSLGVFGNNSQSFEITSFLNAIPKKFKYWDIDLNENNFVSIANKKNKLTQYTRTNYVLSLQEDYEQLRLQYKRLANRMKRKAIDNHLRIVKGEDPAVIVKLYARDYKKQHRSITDSVYDRLVRCTSIAIEKNLAATYLATTGSGETLAYYMILKDEQFVYSLIGGSNFAGKKVGAFYLLTDAIIHDHAGTNKIFRFEGSDIPGISFFDALFGPQKISYQHLVMNNLPFPLRFFK